MSNEQEIQAEPVRTDMRQELINTVKLLIDGMKADAGRVRNLLINLDEMGCAVSRSKTRAAKVDADLDDLLIHYVHDVVKHKVAGTKDQQARAEAYELS